MQDQKTVMMAFRLPVDKRDAFKSYCLERHTTVQALLLSAVDRHLAEAEASPAIPLERALVVVASAWPVRTWRQIKRALTRR